MVIGRNSYQMAERSVNTPDHEIWRFRFLVEKESFMCDAQQLHYYGVGRVEYYTLNWLFSIVRGKGECLSGQTHEPTGMIRSTAYTIGQIQGQIENGSSCFSDEVLTQMYYFTVLYDLTQGKVLKLDEWKTFKRIYGSIMNQNFVNAKHLIEGFKPQVKYKK